MKSLILVLSENWAEYSTLRVQASEREYGSRRMLCSDELLPLFPKLNPGMDANNDFREKPPQRLKLCLTKMKVPGAFRIKLDPPNDVMFGSFYVFINNRRYSTLVYRSFYKLVEGFNNGEPVYAWITDSVT